MKGKRRMTPLVVAAAVIVVGALFLFVLFDSSFRSRLGGEWRTWTREVRRILGLERREVPPEEKRIREEVILKKMDEVSRRQDWRQLVPEYPRPKKVESLSDEEKGKGLRNSPEFKEIDRELKEYLRKKEEVYFPEPPMPSPKDAVNSIPPKDPAAEKVIEKLLSHKEKAKAEKALDENLRLRIKGPAAARKILERPDPPQVKVRVEAEIELTFWVLPNGIVDRAVPTVKGDAELEQIAIQYLKKWRFDPLPADRAQVEQWGSIPLKFKLQ